MPAVQRWSFYHPESADTWVVPINPNEMDTPFGSRHIASKSTSALNGNRIIYEGNTELPEWSFGGRLLDADHYESLREWVYDKPGRVQITDHFGRVITVVLQTLDAKPLRSPQNYWYHEYTVKATVLDVAAPTVV